MTTKDSLVYFRIVSSDNVKVSDVLTTAKVKYQTILQPYVYSDGMYIAPFWVWERLYRNDYPYNALGCYKL